MRIQNDIAVQLSAYGFVQDSQVYEIDQPNDQEKNLAALHTFILSVFFFALSDTFLSSKSSNLDNPKWCSNHRHIEMAAAAFRELRNIQVAEYLQIITNAMKSANTMVTVKMQREGPSCPHFFNERWLVGYCETRRSERNRRRVSQRIILGQNAPS